MVDLSEEGALKKISLGVLTEARRGDKVLICDGMAIGVVAPLPTGR